MKNGGCRVHAGGATLNDVLSAEKCSTKGPCAASVRPRLERSWCACGSVYRAAQRPYGFAGHRPCRIGIRAPTALPLPIPRSVGVVKT